MRLLVFGGRTFGAYTANTYEAIAITVSQRDYIYWVLDTINAWRPITLLIHGGAAGADECAGKWAHDRGVPVEVYKAYWKEQGRSAGPLRNQRMIDEGEPDLACSFPGGKGTADMSGRIYCHGIIEIKARKV